ncbi:MAG: hypothetical protein Q7O66_19120, partial [Dehalococcoidia bacterium]|nr:hypothetical protein [Dehalococcoidia bacterium]
MKCAEHPKVDTNLRCGKCDKPICPKCLVYTPVGARCKDCARLKRLPVFEVSACQYALAAILGASLALGTGVVWAFLAIPFVAAFIPLAVGYLTGEVISRSVNR